MKQQISGWTNMLDGKLAVVTGAARGIGRAAAVALAQSGAQVVGIDICATVDPRSGVTPARPEDLDETGSLVDAAGGKWRSFVLDQRDLPALRSAAAEMNLTGTANAIRAFAPAMFGAAYSASKWGIIGLMKSAALELGRFGVTVNALVPGLIDTPLTRHEERYAQALEVTGRRPTGDLHQDEETAKEGLKAKSPLGVPWIEPEDIAPVVVFLASDAARMVSGATYDVTGGDSANYTA